MTHRTETALDRTLMALGLTVFYNIGVGRDDRVAKEAAVLLFQVAAMKQAGYTDVDLAPAA